MALSPQRIRDTNFKSSRKGYDADEVNAFLEEVAAELEAAQNEVTAMEARARAAVARLQELSQQKSDAAGATAADRPAAATATVDEAETISRTLLLAQRTADTTVAEAQLEADRLLGAARDDASANLNAAREQATIILDEAKADARRAGETERVQVEGEVQALLARRDFLESDVDHLEQYLVAQRERLVEVVATLHDLVQRVPGGLADMRRPLLSAAADPATHDEDIVDGEIVEDERAGSEGPDEDLDVTAAPSSDGPADAGADDLDDDAAIDGGDADSEHDEIAEITRVAEATPTGDDRDQTPPRGSLFDEDGEPTQQYSAINPRETGRP